MLPLASSVVAVYSSTQQTGRRPRPWPAELGRAVGHAAGRKGRANDFVRRVGDAPHLASSPTHFSYEGVVTAARAVDEAAHLPRLRFDVDHDGALVPQPVKILPLDGSVPQKLHDAGVRRPDG